MFNKELNRRVGRLEEHVAATKAQLEGVSDDLKYIRGKFDKQAPAVTYKSLFAILTLLTTVYGTTLKFFITLFLPGAGK
jgi:hypothetical protein